MKRRNFLKIFPAAGVSSLVVNGHAMRPFANSKIAKILNSCEDVEDRVLVLIQLKGGNDGLNMLVPVQQYPLYAALRPSIRIPESGGTKFIDLDNTLPNPDKVGLHPKMTGLKAMYDNGQVAIVQGVGYADMNGSHFKGTDLWLSGGDGTPEKNEIQSGWMGRALQAMYPDVMGAPTPEMPDPLGIQVGDPNPSLGFHTETQHQNMLNLSGQDPAGFYSLIQSIGGAPLLNIPNSEYGEEIKYIQGVENSLSLYAQRISDAFNAGTNSISSYPQVGLADQLKTIARLISGGLKTKIYLCSIGGFDTHGAQVFENQTTAGTHANLLKDFSDAIKAFFDDLEGLGVGDQVTACTFSEFGRCARENGSLGTDHGTLAPMFLFGKNIKAGVIGTNPNLGVLTQDNQLSDMQFDYRQVFATLLQDWLGANNYVLEQTMFEGYTKLPAVDDMAVVTPDCYIGGVTSVFDPLNTTRPLVVYPNPANYSTEVAFQSRAAFDARLTLHSLGGQMVSASAVRVQPGNNFFYLDVAKLPTGTYFVRLENKYSGKADVAKLSVSR
ncbi:MAG: DUF1501 domain-containing protein [Saprospiraceae bacterium]|nr:DUF1501 domain-containing protein [Saprospiraceae bacterium]